jgi:hypothetical protein
MTEAAAHCQGAPPTADAAAPDWPAIADEILCPLCQYNLRGLTQPRCPECGYSFIWQDLLNPARRNHPYLFEQHPERSNWSLGRTLVGGFAPWSFWSKLKPSQPSNPRRLFGYALRIAGIFLLLGPGMAYVAQSVFETASNLGTFKIRYFSGSVFSSWGKASLSIGIADFSFSFEGLLILAAAVIALWPLATFQTLMLYRISMGRAKVLRVHVMRCVIYSGDTAAWAGLAAGCMAAWCLVRLDMGGSFNPDWPLSVLLYALPIWLLVFVVRLVFAYRLYLKFDHAVATVLCTQVILLLALLLIMVVAFPYGYR